MERRTIDELVSRYELEPSLADVLVEGPGDQSFVEWLARELGLTSVMAYEIGTVEVPADDVAAAGLEINNRGRVRYVARELERRASLDLYSAVAGIIDGDLDYFEGRVPADRLIIVTDFTSVEMYCFTERSIGKLLRLVLGNNKIDSRLVLDSVYPVLKEMFLIRTAAHRLQIPLPLIDFSGVCKVKGGAFLFDHDAYATRYITRDEFAARHGEFLKEVATLRERAVTERRMVIHGHDFISVLRWYLKDVLRVKNVPKEDDLARTLRGCLEGRDFHETTLASELLARFSGD